MSNINLYVCLYVHVRQISTNLLGARLLFELVATPQCWCAEPPPVVARPFAVAVAAVAGRSIV